jgi:outer membrane lipoprotein-sorting protein
LRVHLRQTDEPDAGTLVLTFSDRPLALRQWTVIDAQGVRTRVALVNPEFNVAIDNRVFVVDAPVGPPDHDE